MKYKLLPVVATLSLLLQPAISQAKWGASPNETIEVDSQSTASKSVIDSEGNIITIFSDPVLRYDLYAKKTARDGTPLWSGERLLIEERDQSFILRTSLEVGTENSTYVSYENMTDNTMIVAKLSSAGEVAWKYSPQPEGYAGISITYIAASDEGLGYVARYRNFDRSYSVEVGLLDESGSPKWTTQLETDDGSLQPLDIVAVKDGIVVMAAGPRPSDSRNGVFVQKYDFEGNPVWGDKPILLKTHDLSIPRSPSAEMIRDGDGGVAFTLKLLNSSNIYSHYFFSVNSDGDVLNNGTGVRISHGNSGFYNNINAPTLVAETDGFSMSWVARGYNNLFYTIFFQKMTFDGKSIFGSEPKEIHTEEFDTELDGFIGGGRLTKYADHYSMIYLETEHVSGNVGHLKRIDFNSDGTVIDQHMNAEVGLRLSHINVDRSIYGDIVSSFSTTTSTPTSMLRAVALQSESQSGTIGYNQKVALESPHTPWVIDEDTSLETSLRYKDDLGSLHNIVANAGDENATVDVITATEGSVSLQITPKADFNGVIPFTLEVTDAEDASNTATLEYKVRVKSMNDEPRVDVASSVSTSEGDNLLIDATISDPDSEELSIQWTQVGGEPVEFDATSEDLSIDAPIVTADTSLEFMLTVSDEDTRVEKLVEVNVEDLGKPNLSINSAQVEEGQSTTISAQISGAKSPSTIEWVQQSGPALTLSATDQLSVDITAPFVDSDTESTLSLKVTDANGETVEQAVIVNITNKNSGSGGGSSNWLLIALLTAAAALRRSLKA